MVRIVKSDQFHDNSKLQKADLRILEIVEGINYTYKLLDIIDNELVANQSCRLSQLVELANLSSIIGNFLALGIQKSSGKKFVVNKPHTYPDLISTVKQMPGIEIKVALEKNKPKGHLAKEGYYLTFRYFLGDRDGSYMEKPDRGDIVWIWEVRFGFLNTEHFTRSNTPGDSGKTAVINKKGWSNMNMVFLTNI